MNSTKTLELFLNDLASKAPAPGGGGASALCGALAAALSSMVCNLTVGRKKFAGVESEMRMVLDKTEKIRTRFSELIDEDETAFSALMDAFKLPKETDENQILRSEKIQAATKNAALVPLEMMHHCCDLIPLAMASAVKGNPSVISDAGVSALLAGAAAQAAALNVHINLSGLKDRKWAQDKFAEMNRMLKEIREGTDGVMRVVTGKMSA